MNPVQEKNLNSVNNNNNFNVDDLSYTKENCQFLVQTIKRYAEENQQIETALRPCKKQRTKNESFQENNELINSFPQLKDYDLSTLFKIVVYTSADKEQDFILPKESLMMSSKIYRDILENSTLNDIQSKCLKWNDKKEGPYLHPLASAFVVYYNHAEAKGLTQTCQYIPLKKQLENVPQEEILQVLADIVYLIDSNNMKGRIRKEVEEYMTTQINPDNFNFFLELIFAHPHQSFLLMGWRRYLQQLPHSELHKYLELILKNVEIYAGEKDPIYQCYVLQIGLETIIDVNFEAHKNPHFAEENGFKPFTQEIQKKWVYLYKRTGDICQYTGHFCGQIISSLFPENSAISLLVELKNDYSNSTKNLKYSKNTVKLKITDFNLDADDKKLMESAIFMDLELKEKAYPSLESALQKNASLPLPHLLLADYYQLEKKDEEALKKLNETLELNPYCATALKKRGMLYFEKKQFLEALNDFSKLIKFYKSIPFDLIQKNRRILSYVKRCFIGSLYLNDVQKSIKLLNFAENKIYRGQKQSLLKDIQVKHPELYKHFKIKALEKKLLPESLFDLVEILPTPKETPFELF